MTNESFRRHLPHFFLNDATHSIYITIDYCMIVRVYVSCAYIGLCIEKWKERNKAIDMMHV